MCGIVAITGRGNVVPRLLRGLKSLDYRGYDSAGLAVVESGELVVRRRAGRVQSLEELLEASPTGGSCGVAHTRWATHGTVTDANAHPHATSRVAVVHNGIIENHLQLRQSLEANGRMFETETDTECVMHLVDAGLSEGLSPADAVRQALGQIRGAYALVFIFRDDPETLIAARKSAPIAIGQTDSETLIASDPAALAPYTTTVQHLRDGDVAIARSGTLEITDPEGRPVKRHEASVAAWEGPPNLSGYDHHMAREIHEQPTALARLVSESVVADRTAPVPFPIPDANLERGVDLVACGTAHFAGMIGERWIEEIAGIRARAEIASEFRYRPMPASEQALAVFLSQSGETADTLAALRLCRDAGRPTVGIVNAKGSTIDRAADASFDILAGREISVASTKAFTSTLVALLRLAWSLAIARSAIASETSAAVSSALSEAPRLVAETLARESRVRDAARSIADAPLVLYLGRGPMHVVALEGALKLKEISYIHAEGFPAGELKHGPIALVDGKVPVVVLAPRDSRFEKTISNMQEAIARGARAILVSDEKGIALAGRGCARTIAVPSCPDLIAPLVYAPVVQLLAYHAAVSLGRDIDKPRNLAKSVTVE